MSSLGSIPRALCVAKNRRENFRDLSRGVRGKWFLRRRDGFGVVREILLDLARRRRENFGVLESE